MRNILTCSCFKFQIEILISLCLHAVTGWRDAEVWPSCSSGMRGTAMCVWCCLLLCVERGKAPHAHCSYSGSLRAAVSWSSWGNVFSEHDFPALLLKSRVEPHSGDCISSVISNELHLLSNKVWSSMSGSEPKCVWSDLLKLSGGCYRSEWTRAGDSQAAASTSMQCPASLLQYWCGKGRDRCLSFRCMLQSC